MQSLNLRHINAAIPVRSDVHQQIAVASSDLGQKLNVILERLWLPVRLIPPCAGNRNTEFPRMLVVKIAESAVALARREIRRHIGSAIVGNDLRLQTAYHRVDFRALPTEP